jgi:hypothetical protein
MTLSLIIDFIMAILLLSTIGFAIRLNKRLSTIHDSREKLQKLADDFTSSFAYAENSIVALQKVASDMSHKLEDQSKIAQKLRDELNFLVDRGEVVASTLEDNIRKARNTSVATPKPSEELRVSQALKAARTQGLNEPEPSTNHEAQDILRALKSMR